VERAARAWSEGDACWQARVWCGVSTGSTLLVGAEKRRGRNRGGHRKVDWLSDGLLKVATLEPDRAARALYEQSVVVRTGVDHWGSSGRPWFAGCSSTRNFRGGGGLGTRAGRRLRSGTAAPPGGSLGGARVGDGSGLTEQLTGCWNPSRRRVGARSGSGWNRDVSCFCPAYARCEPGTRFPDSHCQGSSSTLAGGR
jgi:hypothetical protein